MRQPTSLNGLTSPMVLPGIELTTSASDYHPIKQRQMMRFVSGNIDGILELYSAQPVFMPEYAPPAVCREAVRKSYEWVFATVKLNGRFIVHEAEAVGDTAWVRSNSTGGFAVLANGMEGDVAKELFVFKRENGAWKIHRCIFTAPAPPAQTK